MLDKLNYRFVIMTGLNKIILIGNLASTPELRRTSENLAVTNLRLGVTDRKKEGNEWINYTEWFNVICFGKMAENATKFLKKGRQVYTEGKLQTRIWKDGSGESRFIMEVIANQVLFLGKKESDRFNEKKLKDISFKDTKKKDIKKKKNKDLSTLKELSDEDIPF
jgi:single-strand DNA-binding protein